METCKELLECLCCGSKHLELTLDLGAQPMANSFIKTPDEPELTFPLVLNRCEDCFHLQLSHAVNPDLLFKNYLYVSGTSQTLRDYFDWFADYTVDEFVASTNRKPATVLDIACNDGSQLNSFKSIGLATYGIDPASNLFEISSANHNVICDYFTNEHVQTYKNKNIDIITAQNVFAHNSYPLEFLQQCKEIMHDDSLLFIQTSQADMVRNNEFDTIYHEHLSFFCTSSMMSLAERAGLNLVAVKKTPIHGTSYVFIFSTQDPGSYISVGSMLADEMAAGLLTPETYDEYAKKCQKVIEDLKITVSTYRELDYKIVGYGAAAKGMTLLNYGHLDLDYIIDDNPLKQGLYSPGMHIPVVSIDLLDSDEMAHNKIAFIPLAWNFFTEIRDKIKTKRNFSDDVFIRYFPKINIE